MRICFLCSEYPPSPHGGIGTFTRVIGRALVAAGHEVRVIGIYSKDHQNEDYEVDQGVKVWRQRAPANRYGWPLARYLLWKQVAKWARCSEIDLVEAPDWEGLIALWPGLSVPLVVRLHGSVSYFQKELNKPLSSTIFKLERSALNRADAWCSVSRYTAEKTKAIFDLKRGPDAILYNPIETSLLQERQVSEVPKVVFTGTLTAKKGIISLVRAWPKVKARVPLAQLHVFGKDTKSDTGGSIMASLKSMLTQDNGCVFHGHVSRELLFKYLSAANVAVFPSYAEAFAIAPLESMTQGCPTIYSKRGSGPELIEDGVNGILIDPDHPDEIAESIIRVIENRELAEKLSRNGRKHIVHNFGLDRLTRKNEDFYFRCLDVFGSKAA